jgi:riboflavin biosynthesis pyrimidine reductase
MHYDWTGAFSVLTADKTLQAEAAVLPRYETERAVVPPSALRIGNPWCERLFDGPFFVTPAHRDRPACSLVFVQSADGNTGARDPSTLGGGATDKHLIYEGLSRVAADAVLAGAETVRSGRVLLSVWHPELVALRAALGKPRHPTQIVASLRGLDIEGGLIYNVPEIPVVILTVHDAAQRMQPAVQKRRWIRVVTMRGPGDLAAAFRTLKSWGIEIVSCIGGRTLARSLFEANLVDDLYLTTGPRPGGEPNTPLFSKPWRADVILRKHGTRTEKGVRFEHHQSLGPDFRSAIAP